MLTNKHLVIRPVEAFEATGVIDMVFQSLSRESRRLRFHVPMPRLPPAFREQLAKVDDPTIHAAIGAWIGRRAVGIGRLARVSDTRAEIALSVADDWQDRGVGRRLLLALVELARDLGYTELSAEVLAENASMLHLLCEVFPDARSRRSRGVVQVTCPLPAAGGTATGTAGLRTRVPAQRRS